MTQVAYICPVPWPSCRKTSGGLEVEEGLGGGICRGGEAERRFHGKVFSFGKTWYYLLVSVLKGPESSEMLDASGNSVLPFEE